MVARNGETGLAWTNGNRTIPAAQVLKSEVSKCTAVHFHILGFQDLSCMNCPISVSPERRR
jgi:hypothetical protein